MLEWFKGNFYIPTFLIKFNGKPFSPEIIALKTPLSFFEYFINNDILEHIKTQSIIFSTQHNEIN